MIGEKLSEILLLVFLSAAALIDVKRLSLPIALPAGGFIVGALLQIIFGNLFWPDILFGCLIGFMMILLSFATRQAIGYGDGMILIASGIFLGFFSNLLLLICGLVLSAIFSGVLMILEKTGRKSRIPFQPFLLGGYVFMLAIRS